jgi:hypothetical protein
MRRDLENVKAGLWWALEHGQHSVVRQYVGAWACSSSTLAALWKAGMLAGSRRRWQDAG